MKQLMNNTQIARYDMLNALLAFFGKNASIVAEISDLADLAALLTSDRNYIDSITIDRDEKKTAFKDVKPIRRSELGRFAFTYSRKLKALGKMRNITELKNLFCPPISEIDKMRFSNFSEYCSVILNFLKKYLLQLSGQQVTQATVDDFEAKIKAYKALIAEMDEKRDESIEGTEALKEKFKTVMLRIHIIDDIIDGMRKKYKEFCDTYDVARVVHNYGIRHRTPEEIAISRAKAAERQAKYRASKKERAAKARAEKIQKLKDKLSLQGDILPSDTVKGINS